MDLISFIILILALLTALVMTVLWLKERQKYRDAIFGVTQAKSNLEKLTKIKSEFLDIASHQLRTPTSIVRGMLSMIVEGDVKGKEREEFIEKSYEAITRLERIIHDVLVAMELEGEELAIKPEPVSLDKLAEEVIQEYQDLAKERNIGLTLEVAAPLRRKVLADKLKVREAIANLVDNALHYTEHGRVTVAVEGHAIGQSITINDTGIGMEPEDKEKLFKKFSRGKQASQIYVNGTGLGLYIVKSIADAHRGNIEVQSGGPMKGSSFRFTLPYVPPSKVTPKHD